MDTVRFGRALGVGAREAAKALVKAADAAASPNPTSTPGSSNATLPEAARPRPAPVSKAELFGQNAARTSAASARQIRAAGSGAKREGKRFGEAVWNPLARLSGVLWLEVTGVFFGLFALTAGIEAWKRRTELHGPVSTQHHLWFALGMLAIFGYFTASSFVKASRRGRR